MQSNLAFMLSKTNIKVECYQEGDFISHIRLFISNENLPPVVYEKKYEKLALEIYSYLEGNYTNFKNYYPLLNMENFSALQKNVYEFLIKNVAYGSYKTYGQIALELFSSKSYSRVVGLALKKNPLPIIIPCHRVLPSDFNNNHSLGGFNQGIDIKKKLLEIEKII